MEGMTRYRLGFLGAWALFVIGVILATTVAAAEWQKQSGFEPGVPVVFAAFGAGFHWGALLAEGC